jgi:hypothetical protein
MRHNLLRVVHPSEMDMTVLVNEMCPNGKILLRAKCVKRSR